MLHRTYVCGYLRVEVSSRSARSGNADVKFNPSLWRCRATAHDIVQGIEADCAKNGESGEWRSMKRFFLWTPHPYVFQSWPVATKRPTCCEARDFVGNFSWKHWLQNGHHHAFFLAKFGSHGNGRLYSFRLPEALVDFLIEWWWHLFQVRMRASNLGIVECSPSILLDCKPGLRARSIVTDHLTRLCFQSILGSTLFCKGA